MLEVDPRRPVVRNPGVHARPLPQPSATPAADVPATPAAAVMVDVVVLSGDLTLYEAIRESVGERNPVWRARSAAESVDLLMTGRCGVLLIDMAAVSTRPATLVEQIVDQFPDVVVIVAGRREDESLLAGLISDGLVYRFMHKPLSPKRAGMFLNAAMRSHVERRAGHAGDQLLPLVRELRSRVEPRKWLFVGGGLLLFLLLLAAALAMRHGTRATVGDPATAVHPGPAAPAVPLADPVLSRARAALAAGRYEAPPGRNALDLYAASLLTRPDDPEAHKGLATTIAHLLANAESAAAAGNPAEARRIAARVLRVDESHTGARALLERLTPKPRPVTEPSHAPAPVAAVAPSSHPTPAPAMAPAATAPPVMARLAATPPPPARQAIAQPIHVQPDPLTPRIIGPGVLPTSPSRPSARAGQRSFGPPVSSGHPTAGYVSRPPPAVTASSAASAVAPPQFNSAVQSRDLEPIATPAPEYPPQAFREGIAGWAEVDFTVTERGITRDVEVVASEPRGVFEAAAIAAVASWQYRPRVVNGQPIAERTTVTLRFSVED